MELAQRFAGLDSELVDERGACVLVGGERFCLAAGAVERNEQQLAQALAQRVFAHERLQLTDELSLPTLREVGVESLLETRKPQLLEAGDLGLREPQLCELGERRRTPQRERVALLSF